MSTRADDKLGEVAGWCAIVAAGLLLPDGRPRRLYGEAGLVRALGDLVGDDGGVLSRSPLQQMEAIALLVKLRACYDAVRPRSARALRGDAGAAGAAAAGADPRRWLAGSWQGAWAIAADEVAALVEASGVRTRPLRDVRQWGYQRVVAQKSVLLFDAAPPPLAAPRAQRLRLDAGVRIFAAGSARSSTAAARPAAGGLVPVRLEQGLRATAAHSTLVLDDANSTAVLINGKIGTGRVRGRYRPPHLEGASATGRNPAGSQPQRLCRALWPDPPPHPDPARRWHRTARRGPAGAHRAQGQARQGGFAIRFHLGPGIDVGLSDDGQGAGWRCPMAATGSSAPAAKAKSRSRKASGSMGRAARCRCSNWCCKGWSRAAAAISPGC
jgi:hypothetical protein